MLLQPKAGDRIKAALPGFLEKMIFNAWPVATGKKGLDVRVLPQPAGQIEGVVRRTGPFMVAVQVQDFMWAHFLSGCLS